VSGHRRTPNRPGIIPSAWAVVCALVVCVVAAGGLAALLLTGDTDSTAAAPTPTASATTPAPVATTPTATPTPTPTPSATTPEPERTVPVSVFNNTSIRGLAAGFADQVQARGWTIGTVGDWNGQIPSNTVYVPAGLEEQGRLLADDMGIDRIRPAFDPMGTDRLTVILSGPQDLGP